MASWFQDTSDTELNDLIPFFERLSTVDNVYKVLKNAQIQNSPNMPLINNSPQSADLHNRAPLNSITTSVLSPNPTNVYPPTNFQSPQYMIHSSQIQTVPNGAS